MAHSEPVKISPKDLKNAEEFYSAFIRIGKWAVIAVAAVLILMALIFV